MATLPGKWRKMNSKNTPATVISELLSATTPTAYGARGYYSQPTLTPQQYLYFTEPDTQRILDNLDGLRDLVFPPSLHVEDDAQLRLEYRAGCRGTGLQRPQVLPQRIQQR